jgi:hypothetical protein
LFNYSAGQVPPKDKGIKLMLSKTMDSLQSAICTLGIMMRPALFNTACSAGLIDVLTEYTSTLNRDIP